MNATRKNLPEGVSLADLTNLPLTHQATIPEDYLDMNGHMNVMWYTHLFAHALGGMFKWIEIDRDYLVSHQAGCFALKQYVDYLNEVRFGEHVSIHTRLLGRSPKRVHLVHFMVNSESGVLAATSEVLLTHIDMRIRRSSAFPPDISVKIDQLLAEHNSLAWIAPRVGTIQP